jgi:hypothetical protein
MSTKQLAMDQNSMGKMPPELAAKWFKEIENQLMNY